MSFLSPFFLFALIAVGLPLVIHLLNLRKPQYIRFSNLSFFKELQKTTIRKIRIKRLILLLLRLFAVACLATVLARPFLPPGLNFSGSSNQPALNAIIIDNSISMARVGSKGPLIDQAIEIAKTITETSKDEDRFLVQVSNNQGLPLSMVSKGQADRRLDEIDITAGGAYLKQRISELIIALQDAPYENRRLFLITDGNTSQSEFLSELEENEVPISVSVIKVESVPIQNTYITDVLSKTSMVASGSPFSLTVQVSNSGEVLATNQFLTLEVENETTGQYPIQLGPGETRSFEFELFPQIPGSLNGKLSIEGDDFSLDNEHFFTIEVPATRNVLWVNGSDENSGKTLYTGAILDAPDNANTQLSYTEINPQDFSEISLKNYDAVILDGLKEVPEYAFEEISKYVEDGKSVLFFPSQSGEMSNYNRFLEVFNAGTFVGVVGDYASFERVAEGSLVLEDHPVFSGLFERSEDEELSFTVPDIYYYFKLQSGSINTGINLIELNNGDVLIKEKSFGKGKLFLSSIGNDPGWSNFPVKALYAPFYYRTILYAASGQQGGFVEHILGKPFTWTGQLDPLETEIIAGGNSIKLNNENLGGSIRVEYNAADWLPGWVELRDDQNSFSIAVNLSPEESDFSENSVIEEESKKFSEVNLVDVSGLGSNEIPKAIESSGFGKEVWHWFMLAGLLFLIAESLVSVFFKAETIT